MPVPSPDEAQQILIVVGAHLRAEIADRPLAYELADAIRLWRADHAAWMNINLEPLVLTDLWYLNDESLQQKPTISLGGPEVNALSNAFAKTMDRAEPSAEPTVLIQFDPEYTDLRCCIWGTDHGLTAKGLELFIEDYLDRFLRAVANQVEPKTD